MHEKTDIELRVVAARIGRSGYTLKISGEVDMWSAPLLKAALDEVPVEVRHVLVDVSDVGFVDSLGLATLVAAARRMHARGGTMLLVVDDPALRRTLVVTGLDRSFEVRTPEDAPERELVGSMLLDTITGDGHRPAL